MTESGSQVVPGVLYIMSPPPIMASSFDEVRKIVSFFINRSLIIDTLSCDKVAG